MQIRITAFLLPLLVAACARPLSRAQAERILGAQAERWNAGDLEGFVGSYWNGPELTFLGAQGLTRGRADLLARYQERYPDAESRGRLSFEVLEFRPLGNDHALLLGRYSLDRAEPTGGYFTLLLARDGPEFRILHDHSSESP